MGRKIFSLAAVLALATASPVSADPQDLYRAGLRAFEFGYWREALVFFEAAAGEEPREGASVREYGMWRAPYLPHFHQGVALCRLGRYAQALEALAESEAQGAIRRRKNRKYYRRLRELRDEIRKAIEWQVGELHRGAAADYRTLDALRESPALDRHGVVARVPAAGEIDRILESTASNLDGESLIAAASELQRAMSLLEEAREGIATLARSIRQRERELEEEKRRVAEQARRNRVVADTLRAKELIAGGECRPLAIELLEGVEQQAAGAAVGAELDLWLAQAHLQCGHLALASEYLGLAGEAGKESPQLATLRRDLAGRWRRQSAVPGVQIVDFDEELLEALTYYLLARVLAGEEGCREREVTRRIERAEAILGSGVRVRAGESSLPASLPFRYTPNLVLARAHQSCGSWSGVDAYRTRAQAAGAAPAAALAELETWLNEHRPLEPYTGSFALLVGAYDYHLANGWSALYEPGADVREIYHALQTHGFQVETVINPTGSELEAALDDFFFKYGGERSHRLVFYYAGHGHTEQTLHGVKLGFIVPVDAGDPEQDRAHLQSLFGMERFREYAIRSDANDMLFMFDSCFAGTLFEATRSCLPPECVAPGPGGITVREKVMRPVRMFLTAGSEDQMVPDRSVFRRMVIRALRGEADGDHDGMILGSELGSFVQNETLVEQRTRIRHKSSLLSRPGREPAEPQWGRLDEGGFGAGDILFRGPEPGLRPGPNVTELRGEIVTELAYWQAARKSRDRRQVRRYLERFPEGHFAQLAEWILSRGDDAASASAGATGLE